MNTPTPRSGFTLIEVSFALVILAGGLVTLLGTQSNAVQRGTMANEMTIASLLARTRMLELENQLNADGFNEDLQTESGDFRQEGYPQFSWEAEIEPINIDEGAAESLTASANSQLFGTGEDGSGGTFTGNAAFAAYLPMVVGLIPDLINRFGEKARKVTLKVYCASCGNAQELTLVQYISDVSSDEQQQQNAQQNALQNLGGIQAPNLSNPKP